ncbi:TetR family transcriptional regulator [Arthrobacter sp. ERGS1:01]|uniref:TetR/AcrR family transcriptional regulator n=1 Tax=Arthrobacter sp. ERGS1:01 TaxID=1704044 RepID=UPI0006B5B8B6|nr:TetR/AcrR family transcriptional regulator [Arthrobacter sp. ERGS1:01]ALE06026.1 TetR family transcriptional regulator [Arthrobacter sp. ERGS1:01]
MTQGTSSRRASAGTPSGRGRLDRDTIIAAGLKLAANAGSSSISVRELGTLLDADPTAIYRHFRNKEHLMRELLDELIGRSVSAVTADPSDWRAGLTQLATTTLDLFAQYPAIGVEAIVLTTHGPGELDAVEFMLDALSRAGLTGDDLVRHYALMASHVLSSAAGIARDRSQRGVRADEPSPWFEGPLHADPRKYPHISAVSTQLTELEDRELFLLGVSAIIQSAERTASLSHSA